MSTLLNVVVICSIFCAVSGHFITTRFPHSSVSKTTTLSGMNSYQTESQETTTRRKGAMIMSSIAPRKYAAKVIIAGAPAAGKGTQCEMIKSEFGLVHLSTGDILRASVQQGTPLGLKAKAFMDGGQLVPDELIIGVICDRLKESDCEVNGWLLDGFPRTKSQADALSAAGMVPDCFVMLDVPEAVLVERVTGRRTDPVTGKIYHMKFNPPTDDIISSRLVQRSDDTAEKIIVRYREFQSHIDAIKSCYEDKMVRVDGSIAQSEVSGLVAQILENASSKKAGSQPRK
jgi:adenylate kinase